MEFLLLTGFPVGRSLSGGKELRQAIASDEIASRPTTGAAPVRGAGDDLRIRFTHSGRPDYHKAITSPWSRMSLSIKVSLVILLIVGISAVSVEYFESQYIGSLGQGNYLQEI